MKNCLYHVKGIEGKLTYSQLIQYVEKLAEKGDINLLDFDDIMFSKFPILESQHKKLSNINGDYHQVRIARSKTSAYMDGDVDLEADKCIGLNAYLESDLSKVADDSGNVTYMIVHKNDEEYKRNFIDNLVNDKNQNVSVEEATKQFETLMENNDKILEDSLAIHSVLTSSHVRSNESNAINNFYNDFKKSATPRIANINFSDKLFRGLETSFYNMIHSYPNCKIIKNLNLKSKLKGFDMSLLGHIDYMLIDQNGRLHIYNFKVSADPYQKWPSAKKQKYMAQLALLKLMLYEQGVNADNIVLNIIPVHVQYNSDFSKVTNVVVQNIETLSTDPKTGKYALTGFDKKASKLLQNNYVPEGINNSQIVAGTLTTQMIFPDLNVREDGLARTAEEWINYAPDSDPFNLEPLIIKPVHLPNHGYDVIIRDRNGELKTIEIKSDRDKKHNKELLEVVQEHVGKLVDNRQYALNNIKDAILEAYTHGKEDIFAEKKGMPPQFMMSIFSKYLEHDLERDPKDSTKVVRKYKWKLIPELSEANILMFQNNETGQTDVISLSSFNLNSKPNWRRGQNNILGYYCHDIETHTFEGDFGNIELIRIMSLLNEVAPNLGKGFKLGKIQVINTQTKTLRSASASYLNKQLFQEILTVVNQLNSKSIPIENKLKDCEFMNEVDVLISDYNAIRSPLNDAQKTELEQLGFDELVKASSDESAEYEYALFNIINNIYSRFPELIKLTPKDLLDMQSSKNTNTYTRYAQLLAAATAAYQAVRHEQPIHKTRLATVDAMTFTALTVPDENIRTVVENLLITHDAISSEFMDQFFGMDEKGVINNDISINGIFEKYFEEIGYSQAEGTAFGNETSQFNNLYKEDSEILEFKNPYDSTENLTEPERKLLKQILFAINNITHKNNFNYSSVDSPELIKYTQEHSDYFWVPLTRASKASVRQNLKGMFNNMKKRISVLKNMDERLEDALEDLTRTEAEMYEQGWETLTLSNPFNTNMPVGNNKENVYNSRRKMLNDYGRGYFETNLKNIMVDYLFRSVATDQYNKFLTGTKSLLLQLLLTNYYGGNTETLNKEIGYIKDYLRVNVFRRSIMEDKSRKIMSVVTPIKSKVTDMLLMGNVVSAIRDTIQGFMENTVRSIIKLNTDINPSDVMKAYTYVVTHSTPNPRAVNLLSKLCLKYRLSNSDTANPAERAKTGRTGLLNGDNMAYWTLRGPDFLNRMVLFVARCMNDGCWDAISLDERTGEIKYDWKKDKRFNLLATETDINSEEYKKLRALYFSKLREWNKEHPDKTPLEISLETDLPSPYSNKDITSIKGIADNIYGSYDKSKKGMYENIALGISFGSFTTWFNGIYNNYFAKAGSYANNQLIQVHELDDETGKPLYYTESGEQTTNEYDENGKKNQPIYNWTPAMTLGIFPTIATLCRIMSNEGKDELIRYWKANPQERANIRKLLSDLLLTTLFLVLFKGIFDSMYKEHKKTAKEKSLVENLVTELIYKSSSRSYDSFMGPVNVIQQLGDNMNPPYYQAPIKLLKDSWSFLLGDKQFGALMSNNLGFARAFKDTYVAEMKK